MAITAGARPQSLAALTTTKPQLSSPYGGPMEGVDPTPYTPEKATRATAPRKAQPVAPKPAVPAKQPIDTGGIALPTPTPTAPIPVPAPASAMGSGGIGGGAVATPAPAPSLAGLQAQGPTASPLDSIGGDAANPLRADLGYRTPASLQSLLSGKMY